MEKPLNFMVLDMETDDLDMHKAQILEIGYAICRWNGKVFETLNTGTFPVKPTRLYTNCWFLRNMEKNEQELFIEHLKKNGRKPIEALNDICSTATERDLIPSAFNCSFEQNLISKYINHEIMSKEWLDIMKAYTPVCKIPRFISFEGEENEMEIEYKYPKLAEVREFLAINDPLYAQSGISRLIQHRAENDAIIEAWALGYLFRFNLINDLPVY